MNYYKSYEWKIIDTQGLLLTPPVIGPYYDDMNLDKVFSSEEEAIQALDKYLEKLGKDWPQPSLHTYTLITYYNKKE